MMIIISMIIFCSSFLIILTSPVLGPHNLDNHPAKLSANNLLLLAQDSSPVLWICLYLDTSSMASTTMCSYWSLASLTTGVSPC